MPRPTATAIALVLAACSVSTAPRAEITDAASLGTALRNAHGGDVLKLAAGDYDDVDIRRMRFDSPVTITSLNPDHPAVIKRLEVRDSSGLTFTGLTLSSADAPTGPGGAGNTNIFQILSSDHIVIDQIHAHGDLNGTLNTETSGFFIRNSHYVTVSRSEFQHFHNAIGQLDNDHLSITGNWFHDLRDDGIRGGGSSFVTISHNRFQSIHPDADDTDHPDCIQYWTSNEKNPVHDIVIDDNLYSRGAGQSVQGIFFGNEQSIPYNKITMSNNVFAGAGYNAIALNKGMTFTINDNIVARYPDQTSWISVINSTGGGIMHNKAAEFRFSNNKTTADSNTNLSKVDNKTIGPVNDHGAALERLWEARQAPGSVFKSWGEEYDSKRPEHSAGGLSPTMKPVRQPH